jgi:hypothetical protein
MNVGTAQNTWVRQVQMPASFPALFYVIRPCGLLFKQVNELFV